MPDDIERIVDRKLIKQRVHYLVLWKGFEQENNTWESRIDLVADGYSDDIKEFEKQRKESTPRGRSSRRSRSKSPARSRSPSRSRSRRSRSRSTLVSRKLPGSDNIEEKVRKHNDSHSKTLTSSQRSNSPGKSENNDKSKNQETPRRRSNQKQAATAASSSSRFVSRLDEDDDSVLQRSTLAALVPQVRKKAFRAPSVAETEVHKEPVMLSYEKDSEILNKPHNIMKSAASQSSASSAYNHNGPAQNGIIAKVLKSAHLVSFSSVVAVMGSLVVSQMLPETKDETDLWRRWLSFLTPVVALQLFFHQKDAHASAKWVATGLAWRAAAELLLLLEATPHQFEMMVAISATIANLSLLIALVFIIRNSEDEHSEATLVLLILGILTLFLSDSLVILIGDSELQSRVVLMSMAVLTIALSPMPTVRSQNDD